MKRQFRSILKQLEAGDIITLIFITLISLLNLIFFNKIEVWWITILYNTLITLFILFISHYASERKGIIRIIRDWYWYPFILVIFKEIYVIIQSLQLPDQDPILLYIDKWIFGVNPTEWCAQFSNPFLTEYLQICYSTFYLILLTVPFWFYIKNQKVEFFYSYFLILFGFYISYIGYILVPAIGPRFTIHNFDTVNIELPGLFCTDFLRQVINMGESIPPNVLNAAALAQRDCFPSGHAEMTIISIYLSLKFKQSIRWIILIVGISLIIATVYLRYHYVIDVIAGIICAILVIFLAPYIQNWFDKFREVKNDIKKT